RHTASPHGAARPRPARSPAIPSGARPAPCTPRHPCPPRNRGRPGRNRRRMRRRTPRWTGTAPTRLPCRARPGSPAPPRKPAPPRQALPATDPFASLVPLLVPMHDRTDQLLQPALPLARAQGLWHGQHDARVERIADLAHGGQVPGNRLAFEEVLLELE